MPKTMPRMIALGVNSGGDSPGGTYGRNSGTLAMRTSSSMSRGQAPRACTRFDVARPGPAAGDGDHPIELRRVALDVDVCERDFPTRVVLTGRGRVSSRVLSEDLDPRRVHLSPPAAIISRRPVFRL